MTSDLAWVVSWAASPAGSSGIFAGPRATIRQGMRLSSGGSAIRLRLSNPHGYSPVVLDAVSVGIASETEATLASPPLTVLFGGRRSVVLHPGASVVSDIVTLSVPDRCEVLISIYVDSPAEVSTHPWANRFAFSTLGAAGDHTADVTATAFRPWSMSWSWIDAIDVWTDEVPGAIVALGDSITDGAGSDFGTDTRWTDYLSERLLALPPGDPRRRSIVNAGIGGNTVAGYGDSAVGVNVVSRLRRDALSLSGVIGVIVAGGSNDLYLGADATSLIAHFETLATKIREHGARATIATIVPRVGGYGWTAEHEIQRDIANSWIRTQSVFDGVIEFARALEDASKPGALRPDLDADGTHPNSLGYLVMARSVDLDAFPR